MQAYEYNVENDPWLREDIELRCRLAAGSWQEALNLGSSILERIPVEFEKSFERNLVDLGRLQRRALAYACHLRETNLANILRAYPSANELILQELRQCLLADLEN